MQQPLAHRFVRYCAGDDAVVDLHDVRAGAHHAVEVGVLQPEIVDRDHASQRAVSGYRLVESFQFQQVGGDVQDHPVFRNVVVLKQRSEKFRTVLAVEEDLGMQIEEQKALSAAAGSEIVHMHCRTEQVQQAGLGKIIDRPEYRFRRNNTAVFAGAAQGRFETHSLLVRKAECRLENRPDFHVLEPSRSPAGLLREHALHEAERVDRCLNMHWRPM